MSAELGPDSDAMSQSAPTLSVETNEDMPDSLGLSDTATASTMLLKRTVSFDDRPRSVSDPAAHKSHHATASQAPATGATPMPSAQQLDMDLVNQNGSALALSQKAQPDTRVELDPQHAQIDRLILDGLAIAKDRLLLLRAELELGRFMEDPTQQRLRVAAPAFPPLLNSYQRLLIHRLADRWKIARELDPTIPSGAPSRIHHHHHHSPTPAGISGPAGSTLSGTIVLVKTSSSAVPLQRISDLLAVIPSSSQGSADAPVAKPSILSSEPADIEVSSPSPSILTPLPAAKEQLKMVAPTGLEVSSSTSVYPNGKADVVPSISPSASPIRIMSRASMADAVNGSSRAHRNMDSNSTAPNSVHGLSLEERVAAYAAARQRIFADGTEEGGTKDSLESQSSSSIGDIPLQQRHDARQHQDQGFEGLTTLNALSTNGVDPPIHIIYPSAQGSEVQYQSLTDHVRSHTGRSDASIRSSHLGPTSRVAYAQSETSETSSSSTTSASSSARTASTSSAARSSQQGMLKNAYGKDGPLSRQIPLTQSHIRQHRPSLDTGSSNASSISASANGSVSAGPHSRHSHSSSSASASTSTSMSVRSLGGSTSATVGSTAMSDRDADAVSVMSGSSKGKGRQRDILVSPLPEPHPSLPARPAWIAPSAIFGGARPSSPVSEPDIRARSEDNISRRAASPVDRGTGDATPSPPASVSSTRATVSAPRRRSISQNSPSMTAAMSNLQMNPMYAGAPKIVEYPPLRYDPLKGWTALVPTTLAVSPPQSPRQSSGHTSPSMQSTHSAQSSSTSAKSTGTGRKSNRPAQVPRQYATPQEKVAPHAQIALHGGSQYAPPASAAPFPPYPVAQLIPQPYPMYQQSPPQFMPQQMWSDPSRQAMPPASYTPMMYPQQGYMPQPGVMLPWPPVTGPSAYAQPHMMPGAPQVAYINQAYVGNDGHAPMVYAHAPTPYYPGAMTPADMLASGEMLYSYDIPRPVPKVGATLFDPNAPGHPHARQGG